MQNTPTISEPFVGSEAVQHHLGGVSPRTLSNYRRQGLPFVELSPRVYRYRLSEIDRWLDGRRATGRSN